METAGKSTGQGVKCSSASSAHFEQVLMNLLDCFLCELKKQQQDEWQLISQASVMKPAPSQPTSAFTQTFGSC